MESWLLTNIKRLLTNPQYDSYWLDVTYNDSSWLMLCRAVQYMISLSMTLSYVLGGSKEIKWIVLLCSSGRYFKVKLEKTFNSSMICGHNMEKKIDIGRLDSGSYGPKLANYRTVGMLSNMETQVRCTHVLSSTSKLDGERYIHNSSILWWNNMKLGGYVDDTIGHLSSFEYMSDFAWNLLYAGHHVCLPLYLCQDYLPLILAVCIDLNGQVSPSGKP